MDTGHGEQKCACNYVRKKAGLIFIEDVPRTYPAPEET